MISETVRQECYAFIDRWNAAHLHAPLLHLDFTWPSVGVLDSILRSPHPDVLSADGQEALLRGASAYVAIMLERAWGLFDKNVIVKHGAQGVVVRSDCGPLQNSGGLAANIDQHLRTFLPRAAKDGAAEPPPASLTPLGETVFVLFSGFTAGTGAADDGQCTEQLVEHQLRLCRYLAQSCAVWYARVFPDEPFGQDPQLYPLALIAPWTLSRSQITARQSILSLVSELCSRGLDGYELQRVSGNLACCPDEQLSLAGLCLFGASSRVLPSSLVASAAQARRGALRYMRKTMQDIRTLLDLPSDWVLAPKIAAEERNRIELERALNFIPYVYLEADEAAALLEADRGRELLFTLTSGEADKAAAMIDRVSISTETAAGLELQRIQLELSLGRAADVNRLLERAAEKPLLQRDPRLHELLACAALQQENVDAALPHLRKALGLLSSGLMRARIAEQYGFALLRAGRPAKAVWALNIALRDSPFSNAANFYKALLGTFTESEPMQAAVNRTLSARSPLDPRAIALSVERLYVPGRAAIRSAPLADVG